MEILEKAFGELGKKLEKTPGFGYVAALASTILGIVLKSVAPESSWWLALLAIAGSFIAYWVGGFLDDLLFEPIYGLSAETDRPGAFSSFVRRSALTAGMIKARAEAAKKFHPTNQEGIYKTAKKLLSNTESWDGRIKLWLDLSKATRTLIVPAVCLLGCELLAASTDLPAAGLLKKHAEISWLWHPISSGSVAVISILLYVNLRLRHMRLLYNTVAAMPAFRFVVSVHQPTAGSSSSEVLWSVGCRVISERELPVCQTASGEKEQPSSKLLQPTSGVGASG